VSHAVTPPTVLDHLARAQGRLVQAGLRAADAALDAEVLVRHALGWDRAAYLARRTERAPHGFAERLAGFVDRRTRREPVAYIIGHREFWGLDFLVSPAVLIPRPDTELIVQAAVLLRHRGFAPTRLLDVGTGSGCLAVSLAREFPHAHVVATDISPAALAVARRNGDRLDVGARLSLVEADLLDGLDDVDDLIVSNPPYVPSVSAPGLQPEVREHEPAVALFGGPAGLDLLGRLFAAAPRVLAPGGWLIVEFGLGQEDDTRALAVAAGWAVAEVHADLQGIPRVAVMRREP